MEAHSLLPRGVYLAAVLSSAGESILYAVDHRHCLLENPSCVFVPKGENPYPLMESLWDRLDSLDPVQIGQETLPAAS